VKVDRRPGDRKINVLIVRFSVRADYALQPSVSQ
jgi:hypothetical protein